MARKESSQLPPTPASRRARCRLSPVQPRSRPSDVPLQVFCQNAFCRRLYNISPTIVWVPSADADFQKRLGTRIREIRTARGYSQEDFAEACDLHRTHVSLLERGRINVTVNTVRRIARVLQITLSELFRGLN